MASCNSCAATVSGRAHTCPSCGEPDPTATPNPLAPLGMMCLGIVVVFAIALAVYTLPGVLALWFFAGPEANFHDVSVQAMDSGWCWAGSTVFWLVVAFGVYLVYDD